MPVVNPTGNVPSRLRERMMSVVNRTGNVPARLRERMNSPLESRKVRLRGLGGPAVCGVPRTGAPATGRSPHPAMSSAESRGAPPTHPRTHAPLSYFRTFALPPAVVPAAGGVYFPALPPPRNREGSCPTGSRSTETPLRWTT